MISLIKYTFQTMTNKSFVPSVNLNKQGTFCSKGKRINWEKEKGQLRKKLERNNDEEPPVVSTEF